MGCNCVCVSVCVCGGGGCCCQQTGKPHTRHAARAPHPGQVWRYLVHAHEGGRGPRHSQRTAIVLQAQRAGVEGTQQHQPLGAGVEAKLPGDSVCDVCVGVGVGVGAGVCTCVCEVCVWGGGEGGDNRAEHIDQAQAG
jgi:hypothetical protein